MSRRYRWMLLALLLPPMLSEAQVVTYTRVREIAYHDDAARWVMGQVAQTKVDGSVVSATTYHPTSLLPTQTTVFGKVQHSLTYYADGTLATVKDGNNQVTTLGNWKRGIPQSLQYADLKTQSAEVNNFGWITAVTDEVGARTCYSYDAMGRITQITYPSESQPGACDPNGVWWTPTTQAFAPSASAKYGIPKGHWQQTVSTGNAVKITYFDALWRPLVVEEYDAADVSGTKRFRRYAYDEAGREAFASYPGGSHNLSTGIWTQYDALGRVTSVGQDNELSAQPLLTLTEYLPGLQTRVTNARGVQTATQYQAYSQPVMDAPVGVTTYAGSDTAATEIGRDAHGKPTWITRRNADGSVALARYYAYNAHQELCKQWEPETRGTIFAYDGAGNLTYSASGLNGVTADSVACNAEQFGAGRTVERTYDARNRLTHLAFPDGNGNQVWTYTDDGLPETVTTDNNGNVVTNTYSYNARRLLTQETMNPGLPDTIYNWTMGYVYNALGQVVQEALPANAQANYVVNALGQVTQASVGVPSLGTNTIVASGATYFPNGALKQFTYGNGIVHTLTQNARQLPSLSLDCATGAGSCTKANRRLHLTYGYDKNGNVSGITDGTSAARQTRTMSYDGLDRLTGVTSPMFGTASYGYNALDNLTHVAVGASTNQPARDHYYCYGEGNNRLLFVRSGPQCTGNASPAVIALTYDVQGNLWTKNNATFGFDYGNRLRSSCTGGGSTCSGVGGTVAYRYDAQGRRVKQDTAGAQQRYSMYANDGRLVWQRDEVTGQRIHNLYFAGSLVAEFSRPTNGPAETITYQHTDALGSPIARTNASKAVIETSEYEPYGALVNRNNNDRAGYTGHVMDSATGMTYMQQRYFDSQLGIFGSVDPVTAYSNPVGMFNRYRGFNNNPYTFIDPDGRQNQCTGTRLCNSVSSQSGFSYVGGPAPGSKEFRNQEAKKIFLPFAGPIGSAVEATEALLDRNIGGFFVAAVGAVPSWRLAGITAKGVIGFAPGTAMSALNGMRGGGGHAIRKLEGSLIPNTGSLQSRVDAFKALAAPILENPVHAAQWRIGATQGRAFLGTANGQNLFIVVASEGPHQGKVVSAFVPDSNQLKLLLSR